MELALQMRKLNPCCVMRMKWRGSWLMEATNCLPIRQIQPEGKCSLRFSVSSLLTFMGVRSEVSQILASSRVMQSFISQCMSVCRMLIPFILLTFFFQDISNCNMLVVANVPQLPREELWSRNEWIKWWGRYQTFRFREGRPRWLITSYGVLTAGVLLVLALPAIQLHRYSQHETSLFVLAVSFALLLGNLWLGERFCSTDPGIASFSLPIINESQLAAYKKLVLRYSASARSANALKISLQNIASSAMFASRIPGTTVRLWAGVSLGITTAVSLGSGSLCFCRRRQVLHDRLYV